MARPTKQGVDYFPLDVHLDDKFKFIEIKYKLEGFAIAVKLMQRIYSQGYWCKWTEDEMILFCDEVKTDFVLLENVVGECLKRDVFDKCLYENHNILTSKGIQKRYKEIVRRRKDVEWITEYLLIDDINPVNDNINGVIDDINPAEGQQRDDKSTQSKLNKTKSNKTIKTDSPIELAFVDFWEVYPRKEDKKKALEKFKAACKKYDAQMIIDGAKKYAEQCRVKGTEKQFIKLAPTFLNAESFTNDFDTAYSESGQARTGEHKKQNKIDWEALANE